MLKGTLLSHNSGCQVSERRLWDGASFSPGLLNWLCYCRPVQGEGREGESELWCVRYRAFDCDPPPRGRVFTAALSGEGDLALDPSLCFSLRTHPPHTHPFSAAPVVRSLPLRGHFVHHHGALSSPFSLHPSFFGPAGVTNSLRSANFLTFFQCGMPTPLQCFTLASPPNPPTHTCTHTHTHSHKILFSTLTRLHPQWAFSSEKTGVPYVTVIADQPCIILAPATDTFDVFSYSDVHWAILLLTTFLKSLRINVWHKQRTLIGNDVCI